MATEAQNMPPLPQLPQNFPPLSDLGPCKLSSFDAINKDLCGYTVFWSTHNDELLECHQQRRLLFPGKNGDLTTKDSIKLALLGLRTDFLAGACLVQFWGLVNTGDGRYLTTCDQPFALFDASLLEEGVEGLRRYRKHCLEYLIALDQETELGPPGRVFCSGLLECSPDVSYYSIKEYPPHDIAVKYVKRYWAFPVYQSRSHICVGVLEFVSSENHDFFPLDACMDTLKEVGLTTSCSIRLPDYKNSSSCHDEEIEKIVQALEVIYTTHGILVARTWIEANFDKQLTVVYERTCPSSFDSLFTCHSSFYFIQKGHGVVGKAFSSQSACFCPDIKQLSITEYPCVPIAREQKFSKCFAICLRSSCLNGCIYTLEFILPTNRTNSEYLFTLSPTSEPIQEDTLTLLDMIMKTLQQHLQSSFKIASGQDLGQDYFVEFLVVSSDDEVDSLGISQKVQNLAVMALPDGLFQQVNAGNSPAHDINVQQNVNIGSSFQQVEAANNSVHHINVQQNVNIRSSPIAKLAQNVADIIHPQPIEEFNAVIPARDDASMEHDGNARDGATMDATMEYDGNARDDASMEHIGNGASNLRGSTYTLAKACGITREVLGKLSAMKHTDAAKSLGISESTFKRICRRFDIPRWPPRKGGKFNRAINQQEFARPSKKDIGTHSRSAATRLPDDSCIMVKATYEKIIIKFQLPLSARKMDLDEKVATGFKLPIGSFKIMYQDEEDDWVSITCDEGLSISLSMLKSVNKTTIKMSVCCG